ncbi:MAG: OmpA family protein [Pseudomonadota bacterium]
MKKFLFTILTAASLAAFAMPAAAVELKAPATGVPSAYATVSKDSKVVYDQSPTAFCSNSFDKILQAYGGSLKPEAVAGVPTSYAKVSDGKVVLNNDSIAYEPVAYHSIFTAYGFELSIEQAKAALGAVDYAKVVDGKIVFTKVSIAYSGVELAQILSAYNLTVVAEAPAPAPAPTKAERKVWVVSADTLFDFDKSVIKPQFYPLLDEIVDTMKNEPDLKAEIQGHTDSTGTNKYNQRLSERRAKAVLTYLTKKNIDASRLTAVGFGEEKPVATNKTKAGRAQNRRVEIHPLQ